MNRYELRMKIAKAIHDSWSWVEFDPAIHPEDLEAADAVIKLLPELAKPEVDHEPA
jgi:hypothetical protein